jgi:hypothetical protein
MTTKALFKLFIIGCFYSCVNSQPKSCIDEYSKFIVSDVQKKPYLLTVMTEYRGEKFKIVIEDFDLSQMLIEAGEKYESEVVEKLIKGEKTLKPNNQKINELKIIRSWKSVDDIVKNGMDYTLEYYFYNTLEQPDKLSDPERDYLIDYLVQWCIPVYTDDESGYLKINTNSSIKKKTKV